MDYVTQKIIAKKPSDININQINTNYVYNNSNNYSPQASSNNNIINSNKTIVYNS
jgi:hypothetical protein